MTSIGDVELRSIVKFCVALEKSPTESNENDHFYKKIQEMQSGYSVYMACMF